ncbi:MAG: hypothetical protein SPI42_05150, partial [Lactobacillus johnsonii]|nr:hypothetical protein [Lactobacillus johnsonii]MDY6195518.1 hypothetical protein [Lactobacillus johnsonii]
NATLTDHSKDIAQLTATAKELSSTLEDADGRLSKVEQTAKEHSSTLSDLQGNLSQVKQTATGLVTTLKDAQGNIDQIKQDAKGTSEQLSNAQGDITALQKDVGGIKLTIADHDKNIHTLQADSETLKDDMTDAKGNISSLQKTSASLVSEFRDHDGRLSKVEQTATEHTSELADTKGNIDKVTQKANNLQLLLSDAQKNINNIKVDAQGLHQALTGQSNQLANLNVTLNNLDSKYSGITGDLQSKQAALSTEQKQTKDMLLNKADKSEVDNVKGTVNQVSAEQKIMAGQISQKVSSAEYQTLRDKVNGMKIGGRNYILNSAKKVFSPVGQDDYDLCWDVSKEALNANPDKNGQYKTHFSFDMQASSALPIDRTWRIYWRASPWTSFGIITYPANTTSVQHYELKITTPATQPISDEIFIRFMKEDTGNPSYTITNSLLTIGDVFEDYSPNPDDAIASIEKNSTAIDENSKALKLKADATEVNNLKGTVNSHSASINLFSDQLKNMVTESKVNDIINGKGFTTQNIVQSLIDQKAGTLNESITNLTTELKNNSGGGINLLLNTGTLQFSANVKSQTNNPNSADGLWHLSVGSLADWLKDNPNITKLGISYDYELTGTTKVSGIIRFGVNQAPAWEYISGYNLDGKPLKGRAKIIVDVTDAMRNTHTDITRIRGDGLPIGATLKITHPKWEIGAVTPYSQAPSDDATVTQLQSVTASIDGLQSAVKNKVDQSQYTQLAGVVQTKVSQSDFNRLNNQVNVQTLDSANIDNMKTTGHYFVRNLAGNPIGGWVYVDVTGNANDRIRQDVYQDSGTKHAFRRWFGTYWTGWSTGAEESEITQLRSDINLRVKSGDLLSQINIAAGHTLIQSNKIYFDADSFVMSPNSKAFIPSAYITDINADKINTGTLHSITINNGNGTFRVDPDGNVYANSMHVNNGSIYQGTVLGADLYSISNLTSNSLNSVNDATQNWVKLKDGTIELHGANGNHYSAIMPVDISTSWNIAGSSDQQLHGLGILDSQEIIIGQAALYSDDNNRITHSTNLSMINRTNLTISGSGIQATLAPDWGDSKGASFTVQKDNKVGFYAGDGDNGNELRVTTAGNNNRIAFNTNNFDIDGEVNIKNNHGLTSKNVHVTGWLGVDGSKNSIVRTSQGTVAINAYETAEYYFGDIGEGQTDSNGVAYVGIEKLFNETVNTSIPYQVFITAYGPGNVWVEQRKQDRFMVKSSQPNIKFGWEIKAKRKGYEHTRLQNVDNKLNHMEATS